MIGCQPSLYLRAHLALLEFQVRTGVFTRASPSWWASSPIFATNTVRLLETPLNSSASAFCLQIGKSKEPKPNWAPFSVLSFCLGLSSLEKNCLLGGVPRDSESKGKKKVGQKGRKSEYKPVSYCRGPQLHEPSRDSLVLEHSVRWRKGEEFIQWLPP